MGFRSINGEVGVLIGRSGPEVVPLEAPRKEIYLHPGQMYASKEPADVSMIVGSCVSVCIFDRLLSIGGATHYILAKWDGTGQPSPRYGDVAIGRLIERLKLLGSEPRNLQAMVFGGARMFQALGDGLGEHIGMCNVQIAAEILAQHSIAVVTKDIGGTHGRKLRMLTDNGKVFVTAIGGR